MFCIILLSLFLFISPHYSKNIYDQKQQKTNISENNTRDCNTNKLSKKREVKNFKRFKQSKKKKKKIASIRLIDDKESSTEYQ